MATKTVGNTTGQANDYTVTTNSGAVDDGTQRVILATDQPVIPISDNSGSITVDDGGSTLTVDGTVAVTNAQLSVVGSGTEATAMRVTIATDSTGVLSVDDNGSTLSIDDGGGVITVDGTVAATQSGTWNIGSITTLPALVAGTANIGDVDIASIAAGDNNIGNVDVVSLPALVAGTANIGDVDVLTLPSIPAGTNNIGDVDILTIAAGDNNIGNVDIVTMPNVTLAAGTNTNEVVGDVASGVAAAGNPVLVGFRADTTSPSAVTDGQAVYGFSDEFGRQVVVPSLKQLDIRVTPTIDTAAYQSGDRLGSVMTFANCALTSGGSGTVVKAVLEDEAASSFEIWLHLFKVSPTLVNADNGVLDITDANLATALYVGTVKFLTTDSKSFSTSSRVVEGTWLGGPPAIGYTTSGSSSLFGVLEARGAYDAAATDDLVVTLTVIRDQ